MNQTFEIRSIAESQWYESESRNRAKVGVGSQKALLWRQWTSITIVCSIGEIIYCFFRCFFRWPRGVSTDSSLVTLFRFIGCERMNLKLRSSFSARIDETVSSLVRLVYGNVKARCREAKIWLAMRQDFANFESGHVQYATVVRLVALNDVFKIHSRDKYACDAAYIVYKRTIPISITYTYVRTNRI